MPAPRIGEILVAEGVLTEAAVNRALGYQRVSGEHLKLGTILLNWDLLAEEGLLQALSRHYRVAAVPGWVLLAAPIDVTRLLSATAAIRLGAFPYSSSKSALSVAFLDPGNLASLDEVSAIANKRVVPAVALEIRMLQAHQKFYGRHIPLEYRSIVQKIERRTTKTPLPDWQRATDFRSRNLLDAEKQPMPPPPPDIRTPPANPSRSPFDRDTSRLRIIRVERGLAEGGPLADPPFIEIPDMPMPGPPIADDHDAAQLADGTLSNRMGPRFAPHSGGGPPASKPPEVIEKIEFRPAISQSPTQVRTPPRGVRPPNADDTLPLGFAAHLPPQGSAADPWRLPAETTSDDAVAARMWQPSETEIEASIGEARTREEIAQLVLDALLARLPRVLLLGCGKTTITGWHGRGEGLTPEGIAGLKVPVFENNVFAAVRDTAVPHFGPLAPVHWPRAMADLIGDKVPDCAVFPIRILDSVAAFLYADRLGEPMHYEDFAVVAHASAATAKALTRLLLRRGKPTPVSS